MLNLRLGLNRSCDRVTRRDVLRVGSLWRLGLTLPGFFAAARPGRRRACRQGRFVHPALAARRDQPHRQLRPQAGGTRRRSAASSARSRPTCPGFSSATRLPKLAQHQDKYSILRSLNPRNGSHGVADAYMLSGHPFNPARDLSGLRRGGRQGAGRPQVDAAVRPARHVRSTSGSAAAWRGSWATSTTRSSCRAMRRARISRSATSCLPGASTAAGSSIG